MGASTPDTSAQEQAANKDAVAAAAPVLLKQNKGPFQVDRKRYDPLFRPFHRLNARTYDKVVDNKADPGKTVTPGLIGPSGEGRKCGCRTADDFKSSALTIAVVGAIVDGIDSAINKAIPGSSDLRKFLEKKIGGDKTDLKKSLAEFLANTIERGLFGDFLKFIPTWVPVNRQGFEAKFDAENGHNVVNGKEAEVEVEGRLERSYQTHHHRPYTQWSHYYHWAFHVDPEVGFRHLIRKGHLRNESDKSIEDGEANKFPAIDIYKDTEDLNPKAHLECLLDIGAFSKPPGDTQQELKHPGIFYEKSWPFWPQSGDYFWAAGRYVYDCTHPTQEDRIDPVTEKPGKVDLHPALINPIKAFATARYEATLFDESDDPIPVMRFSFFACRKGGYWDYDGDHLPFDNVNYEFAIDLPPAPSGSVEYEIGALGDFALNTLVIRPRLLQKIEFAPYGSGDDTVLWHKELPTVQIVRPADGSLPRMVKLTVPMDKIPKNRDGYGFTISFGWVAPGAPTGVKKVTVKLSEMDFIRERDDLRMSICVNGRMVYVPTTSPSKKLVSPSDQLQRFPDDTGIVLLLPPEKGVRITAGGWRRGDFGKFIETKQAVDPKSPGTDLKPSPDDRRLQVGGNFNVSKQVENLLRDLADKKISDIVPPELLGRFKSIEKTIDDDTFRKLLKAAINDLVGQRRVVVWDKDVDFQESDDAKKNEIACAVAREMSQSPPGKKIRTNAPKGFVEFTGNDSGTRPNTQDKLLDVQALQARLDTQKSAITTVTFDSRHLIQAEDSEYLVFELNDVDGDYLLKITATISDPDPPK